MENKKTAAALWTVLVLVAGLAGAETKKTDGDQGLYGSVDGRLRALSTGDSSFRGLEGFSSASRNVPQAGSPKVVAEAVRRIPEGARSLIPRSLPAPQAPSNKGVEMMAMVRPAAVAADTTTLKKEADAIGAQFGKSYPGITVQVNWDSTDVNAYAWVEGDAKKKFISIEGGLIRHASMGKEGMALVFSHEVGHHEGGAPRYADSTLSCESQADYWGAGNAMKKVSGDDYKKQMEPAIKQLAAVLNELYTGVSEEQQEQAFQASGKCSYPTISCRKKTYEAAMAGKPKPECAGGEAQPKVAMAR